MLIVIVCRYYNVEARTFSALQFTGYHMRPKTHFLQHLTRGEYQNTSPPEIDLYIFGRPSELFCRSSEEQVLSLISLSFFLSLPLMAFFVVKKKERKKEIHAAMLYYYFHG